LALIVLGLASHPLLAAELKPCGGPYGSYDPGTDKRLPNGGRPAAKLAFPEIQDWDSLLITLDRSGGYSTCPAYNVEIHGDGTVKFHGDKDVAVIGDQAATIAPDDVKELYEKFRAANYFWLFDSYRSSITDFPVVSTSISFDGLTKSVSDYVGG